MKLTYIAIYYIRLEEHYYFKQMTLNKRSAQKWSCFTFCNKATLILILIEIEFHS